MQKYITNTTKKKLINKHIIFSDFETFVHNNEHYAICWSIYDKDDIQFINIISDNITSEDNIKENSYSLIKNLLDELNKINPDIVYFHNGSKFDFLFIMKYISLFPLLYSLDIISRDNIFYSIKIRFNDTNNIVELRDSYLLLPSSLASLASSLSLKKDDFDFKKINFDNIKNAEFRKKLMTYCINDSEILGKVINAYRKIFYDEFDIDIFRCYTIASTALKCFRTKYYNPSSEEESIYIPTGNEDSFLRKAYFGGKVEVFKPYLKYGYYYDVNSLYAYVMHDNYFPVGKGKFVHIDSYTYDLNNQGFFNVDVKTPSYSYIPFLVKQDNERGLISPLGTFNGTYYSEEIKYAQSLGYVFYFNRGYVFEKTSKIFKNYTKDIYNIRMSSEKDSPKNRICKMLLNSLYGRFGMKIDSTLTEIINGEQLDKVLFTREDVKVTKINNVFIATFNSKININKIEIAFMDNIIDENERDELIKKANYKDSLSAVYIAAAVTAYARIYMHKLYLKYENNICYTDTDSLILSKPADECDISNTALGKLKLENIIEKGYFHAPKAYQYYIYNTEKQICKISGVPADQIPKDFLRTHKHNSILNINKPFLRMFNKFSIFNVKDQFQMKREFLKRDKTYFLFKWIDTKPIFCKK